MKEDLVAAIFFIPINNGPIEKVLMPGYLKASEWNHICLILTKLENLTVILNGHTKEITIDKIFIDIIKQESPKGLLSSMDFMGDFYSGSFRISMLGQITDVNIWNKSLSQEDLQSWISCSQNLRGTLLHWDPINFTASGLLKKNVDDLEICPSNTDKKVLFLWPNSSYNQQETIEFCTSIGGNIAPVNSDQTAINIIHVLHEDLPQCETNPYNSKTMLTRYFRNRKVDSFIDLATGQIMGWQKWYDLEPNDFDGEENCVTFALRKGLKTRFRTGA